MKKYYDKRIESGYGTVGVEAGVRIENNLPIAVSAFYQASSTEKKDYKLLHTEMDFTGYGIQGVLYVPANDMLSVTANLGIGRYEFDAKMSGAGLKDKGKETHVGVRYGLGVEAKVTDNLAVDVTARYTSFDYDKDEDVVQNMGEVTVGLKVLF